jgi:hypothetical protein
MGNRKVFYGGLAIAVVLVAIVLVVVVPRLTRDASPGQKQPELSADAKKFVADFGGRYIDPVSTYYAEKAYEQKVNSVGDIMTDAYIDSFNSDEEQMPDGKSDMLGFKKYELPLNENIDQNTFVKVFNEDFAPGLSNLMNHLAKNPTDKARAVIINEFQRYYSNTADAGQPAAFTYDDQESANLIDTMQQVVDKYGSAANYSVAPASAYDYTNSQTGTIFHDRGAANSGNVEYNGKKIEYFFTNKSVDIAINIDIFNGSKSTTATDIIKDTELTIWRQPAIQGLGADRFTDISIGQRKW